MNKYEVTIYACAHKEHHKYLVNGDNIEEAENEAISMHELAGRVFSLSTDLIVTDLIK